MSKFTVYSYSELVEKLESCENEKLRLKDKVSCLEHELAISQKHEEKLMPINELNKRIDLVLAVRDI